MEIISLHKFLRLYYAICPNYEEHLTINICNISIFVRIRLCSAGAEANPTTLAFDESDVSTATGWTYDISAYFRRTSNLVIEFTQATFGDQ